MNPLESGPHIFYINANDAGFRLTIDGATMLDQWSGERNGTFTAHKDLEAGHSYHIRLDMRKTRYWVGIHLGWEHADSIERERREAMEIVRGSDAVIMCTGFNQRTEGEGFDRSFELHP